MRIDDEDFFVFALMAIAVGAGWLMAANPF